MWPDRTLLDLLQIDHPIIQAPMAGANDARLAIAVSAAGGLGSLPCAMLNADRIRAQFELLAQASTRVNVNFFCHSPPPDDPARNQAWQATLGPYYAQLDVPQVPAKGGGRQPFSEEMCELVETLRPPVVSFHFGLPDAVLVARVKAAGCVVLSSATTVAEARWLEARGCDAIIAQGAEAGGHRGMFLMDPEDAVPSIARQPGTLALVPQIVDAVGVPVIAAGGIADGRGIVAALALGAAGVQIGTGYLQTPESTISALHRQALAEAADDDTVLTNVLTGRPARGLRTRLIRELGPLRDDLPGFPLPAAGLAPLRSAAESQGSADFSPLWSGQAGNVARVLGAGDLTALLVQETRARLAALGAL